MTNQTTIEETKKYLRENWDKGVKCPCCTQFVKRYKYSFIVGYALSLIYIYQLTKKLNPDGGWIQVQKEFAKHYSRNANAMGYSQPARWGLLESKVNDSDKTKKNSGYWRITQKGIQFVERHININKYIFMFNDQIWPIDGEEVGIDEALGTKFNYSELMQGYEPVQVRSDGQAILF